jgi:uncharacterized protein with GYD domain
MFGKYTQEAIKAASPERTKKAEELIRQCGGKVKAGYALLGDVDLVFILEFKNNEDVLKASLGLARMLGISFTSAPALEMEDFDKLL